MSNCAASMTMRAAIRRNASGADDYGGKKTPTAWDYVVDAVPCVVWFKSHKEIIDGKSVVVDEIKGYFRPDADIKRGDQIASLMDRRDRAVCEGVLYVESVTPKALGGGTCHLEVFLRRTRG